MNIIDYNFDSDGRKDVGLLPKGKDWPVVYLIHNDKELYVGETQSIFYRFKQHLDNKERKKLKIIKVLIDDDFNKSATLDIEQSLIQLFSADQKYSLQNHNGGQSESHDYFEREKYLNKIEYIWEELGKRGMTNKTYNDIKNSSLFKYSPYNSLNEEQNEVCNLIIHDIIDKLKNNKKGASIIKGSAGTGKTIVLINILNKFLNVNKISIDYNENIELTSNRRLIHDLKEFINEYGRELVIGYIAPMNAMNKTIKAVFRETKNGLKANMVIKPFDVFKKDYDLVFIDEAHRLTHYYKNRFSKPYEAWANSLGKKPEEITQLDMILARTKYSLLVYDNTQTVRGIDITDEEFKRAFKIYKIDPDKVTYELTSQMRCKGGQTYINYVNNILLGAQDKKFEITNGYSFKVFDDAKEMFDSIKILNNKYGLCRTVAGFSWVWKTKSIGDYQQIIDNNKEDIEINGNKFVWNLSTKNFIIDEESVNTIGCIHTVQGYDLNYVGLIFGEEIDYNFETNKIVISKTKFKDAQAKSKQTVEQIEQFVRNAYSVMMTRGIRGCFLYACNPNFQKYLKKFADTITIEQIKDLL